MQLNWLKRSDTDRVIVIFGGWGFAGEIYHHLLDDEYDVLLVSDYRDLSTPLPDLSCYQSRYLLAWSFGVASFACWQKQHEQIAFLKRVAVNGSQRPVDRYLGIPEVVMQKTIDTLSQDSLRRFKLKCLGQNQSPEIETIGLNIDALKEELIAIQQRQISENDSWDKVIVSENDKIFPTRNLLSYWQQYNQDLASKEIQIDKFNAPHIAFSIWSAWRDIID